MINKSLIEYRVISSLKVVFPAKLTVLSGLICRAKSTHTSFSSGLPVSTTVNSEFSKSCLPSSTKFSRGHLRKGTMSLVLALSNIIFFKGFSGHSDWRRFIKVCRSFSGMCILRRFLIWEGIYSFRRGFAESGSIKAFARAK